VPPPSVVAFEQAVLDGLIQARRLLSDPESWSGGRGSADAAGMRDRETGRVLEYASTMQAIINHLVREEG
jgi:predicted transcriptional regulator